MKLTTKDEPIVLILRNDTRIYRDTRVPRGALRFNWGIYAGKKRLVDTILKTRNY